MLRPSVYEMAAPPVRRVKCSVALLDSQYFFDCLIEFNRTRSGWPKLSAVRVPRPRLESLGYDGG
jgi:hypothetical protein